MEIIKRKEKKITKNLSKTLKQKLNSDNIYENYNSIKYNRSLSVLTYSPSNSDSSSNNVWYNTSYFYNKQYNKLLPIYDLNVFKLIKSYFNMYSKMLEKKIKTISTRFIIRFRRLTINRIFTSKINVKHTFNSAIITVSVLNTERLYLIKHLKRIKSKKLNLNSLFVKNKYKYRNRNRNFKRFEKIKKNFLFFNNILKLAYYQHNIIYNNTIFKDINLNIYLQKIFSESLKKTKFILYNKFNYLQLLKINKNKYNYIYIKKLLIILKKIYNKNINLNIINLRSFYYNSDILTNILAMKLRKRTKSVRVLFRRCINNIYFPIFNKSIPKQVVQWLNLQKDNNKLYINNLYSDVILNENSFSPIILNMFKSVKNEKKYVIKTSKNINIIGLRLEAKGRLTKRISAARAVSVVNYKGTLKNMNSSKFGIYSSLVRGYEKDNIQYSFSAYKKRIGSYGIKGWISSY